MSNILVISDSIKVSLSDASDIMIWSGNNQISDNKIFSLLEIVESNAEYCKKEYISLISELGEAAVNHKKVIDHLKIDKNFSFWWTTLIVEKSNYSKSIEVNNAIKIIAFKHWFKKKNYTKIILYSHNLKLIKAMSILCSDINIKLEIKKKGEFYNKTQTYKKFYKYFPKIIQSLGWLLWELKCIWPLKGVGVKKWRLSQSKITFLSSLINLDKSSIQKGKFKSNYWPILPDLLKNNNLNSNWLHMYGNTNDLPNASKAREIINKFNNSKNGTETHTTIHSFIDLFIFCRVILNLVRLFLVKLKIQKIVSLKSGMIWPFLVSDFEESLVGINATRNLLYMYLFKRAFTNLTRQEKGFYLQENQGWEYTFIHSWKKSGHKSSLFAIPHTPIKFWDLKAIIDKKTYMSSRKILLPVADYLGVNSDILKNMHLKNGIPSEKLIEIEALRYLHLNYSSECTLKNLNINKYKVLLLGDIIKTNTLEQIKLLKQSLKYVRKPIQYILKPHPATPITTKDCLDLDIIITNKSINEIIDCCQLAYATSTTSASFDAYYFGAKVVTIVNPSGLNTSPLRGFKDAVFVSTPIELANVLNDIDRIKKEPKIKENILYIDISIPRWKKIFGID
jgi:surface carbohydrate biosynthesis protein (TIGR04326 family)